MRNGTVEHNQKAILSYLLIQRVILFLAFYEYLRRLYAVVTDADSSSESVQTEKPSKTWIPACAGMTNADDSNGNMSLRNGTTINYDYDNRPTSMGSSSFVYDFSGLRVKKNGTVYIGKLYECDGGNCIKYIFAGGKRIASQSSNRTYFYHSDHLGSSSVITDEKGSKAQETYYYPFGEVRYDSGNATHFKFTGQEYDDETGLYYYGARYYDPVVGRFISPDTIVQAPRIPQTLNRYTYCGNNPLIYTDPNGHVFGIDDLLIVAAIGSIVGSTIYAGVESHWDLGEMWKAFVMSTIAVGFGETWGPGAAIQGPDPISNTTWLPSTEPTSQVSSAVNGTMFADNTSYAPVVDDGNKIIRIPEIVVTATRLPEFAGAGNITSSVIMGSILGTGQIITTIPFSSAKSHWWDPKNYFSSGSHSVSYLGEGKQFNRDNTEQLTYSLDLVGKTWQDIQLGIGCIPKPTDLQVELTVGLGRSGSAGVFFSAPGAGGDIDCAGFSLHGGVGFGSPIDFTVTFPTGSPKARWW